MKKGTAAVLVLFFVVTLGFASGLFRGYDRPDVHEEIVADSVVMLHTMDGDQSSEKVVITDEKTVTELLTMHNSLRTQEKSRPLSSERMRIIFVQEGNHVIEWCVSVYGDDWSNAEFITCSNQLGIGNHVVKNQFDYGRLIEIFHAATNQ